MSASAHASWDDTEAFLDGATEAEVIDELQDISAAMDYDFGNIDFAPMPDHVGGYTETDYRTDRNGNVVINSQDIYLNEALLSDGTDDGDYGLFSHLRGAGNEGIDFYDETHGLLDTFYHELIHGKQYRDIWQDDTTGYTEEDLDALLFLHEGQAAFNADTAAYRDAQQFYEEFVDAVYEEDTSPGDALDDMSDQYRVDVVYLDDGEDGFYDFVVTDREQDLSTDEIYERVEDAYGMQVDTDLSYEIDYRAFDADKLGEHIVTVQDAVNDGYEEILEDGGESALPQGYEHGLQYAE